MKTLLAALLFALNANAGIIDSGGSAGSVNGQAITPATVVADSMTISGAANTDTTAFRIAGSTLIVLNNGNVGIGVLSPTSELQIKAKSNSANQISVISRTDSNARVIIGVGGGQGNFGFYQAYDSNRNLNVYINPDSTDTSHFMSKVGISTRSAQTTLDVNGNAQFGDGAAKSTFTATGFWEPYSRTKLQIDTLVPTKVGQVIYASDTTLPGLCVSTGTLAAQWRKMESATLGCGTNN